MANHKFPLTVADKQKLLFVTPASPAELSAWGHKYRESGQLHDALDFYQAARDEASIRDLAKQAVEDADLILLLNIYKTLGQEPDHEQVRALQARALASGKEAVAKRAAILLVQTH